jgi:hypothetical protein
MTGAAGEVGDDKRKQRAENAGAEGRFTAGAIYADRKG